jgi:hypothetical protein
MISPATARLPEKIKGFGDTRLASGGINKRTAIAGKRGPRRALKRWGNMKINNPKIVKTARVLLNWGFILKRAQTVIARPGYPT